MLKKLKQIHWETIHHSHYTAEDFPRWIRQLTSPNKRVRQRAYNEIFEFSNHQGSIYQVTPFVTPFILEMALNEKTLNRGMLLWMLVAFANSSTSTLARLKNVSDDPPEDMTPLFKEYQYARMVYETLWDAFPRIAKLLHSRRGNIRRNAVELLCCFHAHFEMVAPLVLAQIGRERTAKIRSAMIDQFLYPLGDESIPLHQRLTYRSFLEDVIQTQPNDRVKLQTALVLADFLRETMPDQVITTLKEIILHPTQFVPLTRAEYSVQQAGDALGWLPTEQLVPLLTSLLHEVVQTQAAQSVAILLLDRVFFGSNERVLYWSSQSKRPHVRYQFPKETARLSDQTLIQRVMTAHLDTTRRIYEAATPLESAESLTPSQRAIVQQVIETERVWGIPNNILEMYGLPADREAARAFISI